MIISDNNHPLFDGNPKRDNERRPAVRKRREYRRFIEDDFDMRKLNEQYENEKKRNDRDIRTYSKLSTVISVFFILIILSAYYLINAIIRYFGIF